MKVFNIFITAVCFIFLIKLRWPKTKSLKEQMLLYHRKEFPSNVRDLHSDYTSHHLAAQNRNPRKVPRNQNRVAV